MTTAPVPADAYVRRRRDVEWVELDGEGVVYDASTGDIHRLNASAHEVWVRCDGSGTVSQLIHELSRLYPDADDAIVDDVHDVLSMLAALDLVEITTS